MALERNKSSARVWFDRASSALLLVVALAAASPMIVFLVVFAFPLLPFLAAGMLATAAAWPQPKFTSVRKRLRAFRQIEARARRALPAPVRPALR
jgi:hypothetical protein